MKKTIKMVVFIYLFAALLCGPKVFGAEYGGHLKLIWSLPAVSFGYPPKIRSIGEMYASVAMETMIAVDKYGKFHPHLATAWKLAEDEKSWIISLRKGVKFHDGTDFDAEAFKFNMDLFVGKPTGAFKNITSVDVLDKYTARLNASKYQSITIFELASEAYMASPKAIKEKGAKWAETHPVGTGPFKFVSFQRGKNMLWTRFDQYWKQGRPYLDGVEYLFIKDKMTALSALKAGEAHGIIFALPQHAKTMAKQGFKIDFDQAVGIHLMVDSKSPDSPWANKKVRQAAEYAIDKETICSQLGLDYKLPVYQMVKPENPAYIKDLPIRKYNPEKAKKLLKEAGYPGGFTSDFYYPGMGWRDGWQAVQSYLAAVGIKLKLIVIDRPRYFTMRFKPGALPAGAASQMVMFQAPDPLYMATASLASTSPHVPSMKRPPGFDRLLDEAIGERNPAQRIQKTHEVIRLAHDEQMYIPFFTEGPLLIMNPNIHDYEFFEYGRNYICPFTNTYMSK